MSAWWESFLGLLKDRPIATLTVVAGTFLAASTFMAWFMHAEACHDKAESAFAEVGKLSELRQQEILQKQAVNEHIRAQCIAGELDAPITCAKAQAAVEASQ